MGKTLDQVAAEIDKLREDLHQLYMKKNQVTSEILVLSSELDEKINEYLRLNDVMKKRKKRMRIRPVKI